MIPNVTRQTGMTLRNWKTSLFDRMFPKPISETAGRDFAIELADHLNEQGDTLWNVGYWGKDGNELFKRATSHPIVPWYIEPITGYQVYRDSRSRALITMDGDRFIRVQE